MFGVGHIKLVVVDAVSSCVETRDLFENLETLYDYVGSTSSKKTRWFIL